MFSVTDDPRGSVLYDSNIYNGRENKNGRLYLFPAAASTTYNSQQSAVSIYAVCIHTRALHIVMWRWRSDWMAHSINIENENLKQPGVRVKSIHI